MNYKRMFILSFCLLSFHLIYAQNVRINEFMALNQTVLADEDGEYSDWIELYNPGQTTINLEGWSLSDDRDEPKKWIFPDVTIASDSYLLVFASGKNKTDAETELHTNFKLSGSGEYLALFQPSGQATTAFDPAFPAQTDDSSFGFFQDTYIEFSLPTPGRDNSQSGGTVLPPPAFSIKHGLYHSPFSLVLSSEISGAKIYYTTDGSAPGINRGTLYTNQLYINKTSVIRAVVLLNNQKTSEVSTQSYIFPNDIIRQNNSPEGYPAEWGPYTAIPGNAIADYEMDPEMMGVGNFANTVKEALLDIPTISLVTDKDHIFSHSLDPDEGGIYIYPGATGDETGLGWERPVSFEY
nr:lamin tail domain-containing protein [Prolixibacteraceae bacterium]